MPRFAANLSWLFAELPFMDRFRAAREAGFDAVEVLFPYDCPTQDMRDQLVVNGLAFVLMNCPPPNATGGPQGFAAAPELRGRFRHDFDRALRFAGVLKPRFIHVMSGPGSGEAARAALIENLAWATARAPKSHLTIEPINRHDMPGYFLDDFELAADILDAVAAPNLGPEYAEAFNGIYPRLAEKYGVPLYPFFLDGVAADLKLLQSDGIHPTAEGVDIMVERMLPFVEKVIGASSGNG